MNDITNDPARAWQTQPEANWNRRLAAHLYRRAGFGAPNKQIDESVQMGQEQSVNAILALDALSEFDKEMAPIERVFVNGQPRGLSSWWLLRMVKNPCPISEKMTLFWHGHFATSAAKVQYTRAMYDQNQLLRKNALGKFAPMVQGISRDVAMLIYLDSTENRKTRPNENYARELMELFCLGPGNYTEQDIKQIARCFTGWEVVNRRFKFNKYQHDTGVKNFLGLTGNFDGDRAVEAVINHPACGRFIAKKLIRFFVADDFEITDELAEPLAETLRETEFDITTALRKLFSSQLFYSDAAIGKKIKSPVELVIGTLRYLGASTNMERITGRLEELGQLPLYPPNVKGWDGGRKWINASTILSRANLVNELISSGNTRFDDNDLASWWSNRNSNNIVGDLAADLLAVDLNDDIVDQLKQLTGGKRKLDNQDVIKTLSAFAALPEFQLN